MQSHTPREKAPISHFIKETVKRVSRMGLLRGALSDWALYRQHNLELADAFLWFLSPSSYPRPYRHKQSPNGGNLSLVPRPHTPAYPSSIS